MRCTGPPVHKRSCGAPCAGSTRGGRALVSRRRPDSGRSGCASAGLRHRRHGRARGCAAVWWPWLGHCGGAAPRRASMVAASDRGAECVLWIGFSGRKPCRHSCRRRWRRRPRASFSCWGLHLGASSPLRGFSGRKPCAPRTSDGGAFGVVTSLEASFSETHLGLWQCRVVVAMGGFCRWRGKAAGADGWLEGGCSAFVAVAKFMPVGRGLCTGVGSCCL